MQDKIFSIGSFQFRRRDDHLLRMFPNLEIMRVSCRDAMPRKTKDSNDASQFTLLPNSIIQLALVYNLKTFQNTFKQQKNADYGKLYLGRGVNNNLQLSSCMLIFLPDDSHQHPGLEIKENTKSEFVDNYVKTVTKIYNLVIHALSKYSRLKNVNPSFVTN